uniref:keratin, type 1 cytoskeletal 11-like n=1 Tax=Myxine glutinosa TaxID=7769 RepID=UPI00358F9E36
MSMARSFTSSSMSHGGSAFGGGGSLSLCNFGGSGSYGGGSFGGGGLSGGSFGGGSFGGSQMRTTSCALQGNEKQAMQGLNDRLARYLEKVQFLEKSNSDIELKIKELLKGRGPDSSKDMSHYYEAITDLKNKIVQQIMENAKIGLEIDNARLAADDFQTKWKNEDALRNSVEADIANLHAMRDEYTLAKSDLECEIESLQDELKFMRTNHQEEVAALKAQIAGSNMSIEVDAKSGTDIFQMLAELRKKYEIIMDQNRSEAEMAFQQQAEQVQTVVVQQNQACNAAKGEVVEVRRSMQSVQSEMESLRGMCNSLEDQLADVEDRKARELERFLQIVAGLEHDLATARSDINQQMFKYSDLLDQKMKLEKEISTYRDLLSGGEKMHMPDTNQIGLVGF